MSRIVVMLAAIAMLAGCGSGTASFDPASSPAAVCGNLAAIGILMSQMHEAYDAAQAGDDAGSAAKGTRLRADAIALRDNIDFGKGPTQAFNTALYVMASNVETVAGVLANDDASAPLSLEERIELAEEPVATIDDYMDKLQRSDAAPSQCPES